MSGMRSPSCTRTQTDFNALRKLESIITQSSLEMLFQVLQIPSQQPCHPTVNQALAKLSHIPAPTRLCQDVCNYGVKGRFSHIDSRPSCGGTRLRAYIWRLVNMRHRLRTTSSLAVGKLARRMPF